MQPTLVVLAAGLGSRFGSLKQMQPLGPHGEVVLDYAVWDALQAGFGRVVFVVREDFAAQFKFRIGHAFARHIAVDYAFQDMAGLPPGRSKPWGTAHALLAARRLLDGPFAVINADDFYGHSAFVQMAQFLGGLAAWRLTACRTAPWWAMQLRRPCRRTAGSTGVFAWHRAIGWRRWKSTPISPSTPMACCKGAIWRAT
nr:NTP transferase domain-containing protein [uncultured Albidiferax sp.]